VADASLTHGVWLERVPELVEECVDEWDLVLGEPYDPGVAGHVVRADLSDGTRAVLKLIYPHHEARHEAAALTLWDGEGAVRLYEHDEERWAMLIERCEPGTHLAQLDADKALDVIVGLLPKLWKAAGQPFQSLAEEAASWVDDLPGLWERTGRPYERSLLDAATDALRELSSSQGEQVLLHQDLHGENVLAAQREPWLTIDPKPLVGEREFAVAPIVRSFELGGTKRDAMHRLDRLTAELGLDRERALWWTIGQTLAWSSLDGTTVLNNHLQTVDWLLEAA
jgi:streptomycin 6-kinase